MKALVIAKKTLYDLYSNSGESATRRYAMDGIDAEKLRRSHDAHSRSLDQVLSALERNKISYDVFPRHLKPSYFGYDIVVSVGGDGTLLDISHDLRDIPIMGINSDPDTSVGMSCCYTSGNFERAIMELDKEPRTAISRIELAINGNPLKELVFNEAMLYHKDRANLRFELEGDGQMLDIKSCYDLFISTPAGSTGSIYNYGALALPLDSGSFIYCMTGNREHLGKFYLANSIEMRSRTREGIIKIDGEHVTYSFGLDDRISFMHGSPLVLIGDMEKNRKLKGFTQNY
jgi:NAD+ kinase